MFSSYFGGSKDSSSSSSSAAGATEQQTTVLQVHPPKEHLTSPDSTFGPLTVQDTSWLCAGGFTTETQTFYAITPGKDSKIIMCQVIHSAVGMWYPQIQFTFRFFDPATKKSEWRSTNVTNFSAPPPSSVHSTSGQAYDKRSCKSDQFSILVDPAAPDTYHIQGNYDANTQISITYKRVDGVPGWKLGAGPKGGMTYFGAEKGANSTKDSEGPAYSNASDGYVVHRFWPKCSVTGIVRMGNDVVSLEKGTNGIFIHAIQGMRPNLIAQKWNFGYFSSSSSSEGGEGAEAKEDTSTSVVMMEFTTPSNYGAKTVNVGSIVVDDQLVAVIADGIVTHLDTDPIDPDTGYPAPGKIQYSWKNGTSLLPSLSKQAGSGKVEAEIVLDVTADEASADGQRNFKGLIEKVDVLAQIPYLVKKVISYVAGTKPYIYTFFKDTTATITLPSEEGGEARKLTVQGHMFSEATFISSS